jgi:hypothetical protein
MSDLLRQVAGYYDASYPPDILGGGGPPPVIPATEATEVVGGPGDFLPSGCETPSIAQLTSNPVVANPQTAWSTGSHMACTDGDAYWDGTAWITGMAPLATAQAETTAPPPPRRRTR